MQKFNRSWIVFSAALLALTGCGSNPSSPSEAGSAVTPASPPKQAAEPAAPAAGAGPSIAASSDAGTVVFFRESKFVGAAISFKVREGEQELGKLSSGSYFVAKLPPGPHEFTVHSEAKDVLNLELEAGEVYYVQGSISMGVMVGRPNLAPSDQATFEAARHKLKDSAAPKKKS